MLDKTQNAQESELSKQQVEELSVHFDNMRRLANIGNHFLLFVIRCRMIKAGPKDLFAVFEQAAKEEDAKYGEVPILRLYKWIEDPSEENYAALAKSLNIDIDGLIQQVIADTQKDGGVEGGTVPIPKHQEKKK